MAVASGWAVVGFKLARLLFADYTCRWTSRAVSENGCPSSCKFYRQKDTGNVILEFSAVVNTRCMAILSRTEPMLPVASAHVAEFIRGICSPWLASFPDRLQYVVPATEKAGWEPGNKTTRSVLKVNQNPACLWLQVRSHESFCCGACRHAYVATIRLRVADCDLHACTKSKLRAICCLTESTCSSNYSNSVW